jgi:hypothetical protein
VFLHVVPDAELAQHAQRVALQGDAGAERSDVGFDVDELDRDAALGQQDGGRGAGGATADHESVADCGHGRPSCCRRYSANPVRNPEVSGTVQF